MKSRLSLLLGALLALTMPAVAQHTELIGQAGLGLFQFGGKSAVSTSSVSYPQFNASQLNGFAGGYTNSPYGSHFGAGFTVGGRVQRVGRRQGLLAFDLGYDWLRSRTDIDVLYSGANSWLEIPGTIYPANGRTYLHSQHVVGFLGLGHRFQCTVAKVDALLGPEMSYVFAFHEKGSGDYDGGTPWSTDVSDRAPSRPEVALRAEATVWYRRVGANASYSYGLLNYQDNLVGARLESNGHTLRLGLAYRLH